MCKRHWEKCPLGLYLPLFYTWYVDVMSGAPEAVLDFEATSEWKQHTEYARVKVRSLILGITVNQS